MAQMDLPPLNWLRAFEAASRHLSFTGAAGELGMTQSAISQQIKNLEGFLGKPLFFRRTRVLEITEAGRSYLPVVQEAFAGLSAGTTNLRGKDREQVLQVQSNLSFAVFWLAPRLPDLFKLHPWLKLNISTALWDPERTAASSDVEIRFGMAPDVSVPSDRLVEDAYFPVAAPGTAISEAEFASATLFDCIGLKSNWDRWLASRGLGPPMGRGVTYASTYAVSLSAAQSGAGLALAHSTIAQGLLDAGLLQRVSDHSLPMQESYFLIAPEKRPRSKAQTAFCDWIVAQFK
ncbi:MAG: LysR family transcriptional regulator [Rhodobacteraceae bacterium]|nr:LysR family transcriptional regulator [Paracoccaceae bacterium]